VSSATVAGGFILLAAAWRVLHAAQQQHQLATTGAYAYLRHPQYAGFILIMLGFLLQWPTILTLAMFPILVRLTHREEREVRAEFGEGLRALRRHHAGVPPPAASSDPEANLIPDPQAVLSHGGARCST
jgi:protein-S-isoprenylcysteine O-methyltransferase Ste14